MGESGITEADDRPVSFYRQVDDDVFESTAATDSPWELGLQHGGPPSALLARTIERAGANPELVLTRLSVDFFGGIPQGRLSTSATVVRPGRRIELIEATLRVGERVVAVARGWRLRPSKDDTGPSSLVASARPGALPERPGPQPAQYFNTVPPDWGYGEAVEWRFVRGGFAEVGSAAVWARVKIPLVEGEQSTGLQRMVVLADSMNGLSSVLDPRDWLFVPPGITVHAVRVDADEWMLLDATTVVDSSGVGLSQGTITDERGRLAVVEQPLLIQRQRDN